MSTIAIVAIVVGVIVVLALLYFATRGSAAKREQKRHRREELGHAASRERHEADAHYICGRRGESGQRVEIEPRPFRGEHLQIDGIADDMHGRGRGED